MIMKQAHTTYINYAWWYQCLCSCSRRVGGTKLLRWTEKNP